MTNRHERAMASEIESRGLIFELQWKKKPGVTNKEEDIASLGIWDTTDPSLDWCTFKSYLSQNLGTPEDISVAYVDSEGDELPIESECEFQEALKFARKRSRKGRKIILKVDKQESTASPSVATRAEKKRSLKYKHTRGVKLYDKFNHSFDFIQPKLTCLAEKPPVDNIKSIKQVLTNDLEELQKFNKILVEKLERMSKLEEERRKLEDEHRKKHKPDKEDLPPPWFKKYMQKMKHEIVAEVTANTRQIVNTMMTNTCRSGTKNGGGYVATKVKKRSSDEDSSDAALGSDHRDHKLLRKIEKLHKREKKLEKKLDSKLEKLENKTKRMMEKKSQSKTVLDRDRVAEKKTSRKRTGDGPVGTYLMDAILLNDGPKAETHIKLGKRFTKIWEIMNNGTLPWTDKTELRLAWGTLGLEPEESSVKCPILEPGEKGQIAVNFRAPDFPGTFESYWHFYHMGERFGHWIGCAVVVEEPNKCEKSDTESGEQLNDIYKYVKNEILNQEKLEILDNIDLSAKEFSSNDATNAHCIHNNEFETKKTSDASVDLSAQQKSEQVSNLLCNHPNNNNINESPDQQSHIMSDINGTRSRGPEYDSDSDDDNLSIISGIDFSSESDDENFVVVPMPPCFLRDKPLDAGNVPVLVKDTSGKVLTPDESNGEGFLPSKTSHEDQKVPACCLPEKPSQTKSMPTNKLDPTRRRNYQFGSFEVNVEKKEENTNRSETATGNSSPFFSFTANSTNNVNIDVEGHSQKSTESREEAYFLPTTSKTKKKKARYFWQSERGGSPVYAVDGAGSCVLVTDAFSAEISTKIPLGFESSPKKHKKMKQKHHKEEETGSESTKTGNPSYSTSSQTHFTSVPNATFSESHSFSCSDTSGKKRDPPVIGFVKVTSSAPSAGNVRVQVKADVPNQNAQASSNNSQGANDTPVHILPETIVNGVVNVASSAYSTARAVLSNLGVKHYGEILDGQSSGPRSTTENLKVLSEMGFSNATLNVLLLQRYNNDIGKVVVELLNQPSQ